MRIKEYALEKIKSFETGARLIEDKRYRTITMAVFSLVFNLLFAFYNGILGILSSSLIFLASSVYYILLCTMRFGAVLLGKKDKTQNDRLISSMIGVMLIILSVIFQIMVFASIKNNTATVYPTITMITIATFTFTKITMAIITAVKHKQEQSKLFKAINAIRYSQVAVSLLTMQQSMLVSFEGSDEKSRVILNAFTGAGVCFFILALGIITIRNSRKETE